MKVYKKEKIKLRKPCRGMLLILTFLCGIIIISGMIGCATTENDILADLVADPNNPETIADTAEFYYEKEKYNNAYKYYKKLEELKSINDLQKYRMYICESRSTNFNDKSWEKIFQFRDTRVVRTKMLNFKNLTRLIIPEHWIVLSKDIIENKSLIDALDIPDNCEELLRLKNSTIESNKERSKRRKLKRLINRGYIYGGPGFMLRYEGRNDTRAPREYIYNRYRKFFDYEKLSSAQEQLKTSYEYFLDQRSQADFLLKKLLKLPSNSHFQIKDPEFYTYKVISEKKRGSTIKMTYKRIKYNPNTYSYFTMQENLLNYISWVNNKMGDAHLGLGFILWTEEPGEDKLGSSPSEKMMFIILYKVIAGEYGIKITAYFKKKYKKVYIKELKRMLFRLKLS